jgi:putative MATE family efflux protein
MAELRRNRGRNYTEGHILGNVMRMGFPSAIGFAAGNLYQIADMFWVSRLGSGAVAAVTFFGTYYWVISSVNMIAGTGSVSIISRRYGEDDLPRTEVAIKEAILLKWILGVLFGAIGYFSTPYIVYLLGARGEVAQMAIPYGQILLVGLATNFSSWTIYTALRGIGHPNAAMAIMVVSAACNAILDPLFIFGWLGFPAMGVNGAAVASVISYSLTTFFGIGLFYAGVFNVAFHLRPKAKIHVRTMWQMLKIGIPAGITSISDSLGRSVIMPMLAVFGPAAVAVYGAGMQFIHLGIMLCVGLNLGMAALIGQNMGAGKMDRAWETACKGLWLGVSAMVGLGALVFIFAEPSIRIFFSSEPEVSLGIAFFRILALAMPFYGAYILFEGVFTGSGDTVPLMVVGISGTWGLQVPLVFVLTRILNVGVNGVWWSSAIAGAGAASIFYWIFLRRKWLHKKV